MYPRSARRSAQTAPKPSYYFPRLTYSGRIDLARASSAQEVSRVGGAALPTLHTPSTPIATLTPIETSTFIETSTRTFVAAGYSEPTHECSNSMIAKHRY